MISYLLERLARAVLVLLGVILVAFCLVHLSGDPAAAMLGPDASEEDIALVRREMGFDDPIPVQFARYVGQMLRGQFGRSFLYRQSSFQLIRERLPATLLLAAAVMVVNLTISLPLGVLSAVRRGSWVDWLGTVLVFAGQSMPIFWSGILLILLFSLTLRWLPPSGFGLEHLIMPAFVLGVHGAAYQTRLLRSAMLEVLSQDYLRTARAKGLFERLVVLRHGLRNALIPVVTASGLQFAGLMGGTVVIETVFAWPGLGSLAVQAIHSRDVNLVVFITFVMAVFILVITLLVDLSYGLLDPRIRFAE
jgi:peptide/nickel transport system permease protein